jgi:hypothetical protein
MLGQSRGLELREYPVPFSLQGEDRLMRILIVGSQKAGNVWLRCLLAEAYDLRILARKEKPEKPPGLRTLKEWVAMGGFPDGTIIHQHYSYSPELADAVSSIPSHIVTIVRDPYDQFFSYYSAVQHRKGRLERRGTGFQRDLLIEKPLDHPDVLQYLHEGGARQHMTLPLGWMKSGRAAVIRYEDLHRDPIAALARLVQNLGPVPEQTLERTVEACSVENMKKMEVVRPNHIRAAKVGESRDLLDEVHLAVFRKRYAHLIRDLGYTVR